MPELIVIEVPPGETVPVKVASGERASPLSLCVELFEDGSPSLRVSGPQRVAHFGMPPDPVRAAVQAERERIRTGLQGALVFGGVPSATLFSIVDRVIDAPAEPVSEFVRGWRAMQSKTATKMDSLRDSTCSQTVRSVYDNAAHIIRSLHPTEPTP